MARQHGSLGRGRCIIGCVAAVLLGLASAAAGAASMQVPNSRVSIDLPDGYTPARTYSGFQNERLGVSLIVQEMPAAAFEQLEKGFTAQALAQRGISEVTPGRLERAAPHLYLRGRQQGQGGPVAKFIAVLREADVTVLLTANVPQAELDAGRVDVAAIEQALASAKVGPFASGQQLYALDYTGPFYVAGTLLGTATLYTRDGRLEPQQPGRARSAFIVAPSLDARDVGDAQALAERLLRSLAGFRDFRPGPPQRLQIAGLSGVAIEAEAVHITDTAPMRLLQVVLEIEGGGYYRLLGIARAEEAGALLPEFRRMIDSFRPLQRR